MTEPKPAIDWTLTTWEGSEREQLRRWATLSLEEIVRAQEQMLRLTERLVTAPEAREPDLGPREGES